MIRMAVVDSLSELLLLPICLAVYIHVHTTCMCTYVHTQSTCTYDHMQKFLSLDYRSTRNPHHLCLVSYRLPHGFNPVVVPHGNSKSNQPFFPTLPSTKALIEAQSQWSGPKETLNVVSTKLGGVVNARSASQLPRNERQVSYIQSRSKPHASSSGSDEMFKMIQQAKLGDS